MRWRRPPARAAHISPAGENPAWAQQRTISHFERRGFARLDLRSSEPVARVISEVMQGAAGANMRWKYEAAWKQRDRLNPAGRALLVASPGPRYPRNAPAHRAGHRRESDTNSAPLGGCVVRAWRELARVRVAAGHPEWESRALGAFRRALELDSTHVLAMTESSVLSAAAGDSATVRRFAKLTSPLAGDESDFAGGCAALMLRDSATLASVRSRMARSS